MSDNLSHFLIDLASDPGRMAAFVADPVRALAASPLTRKEKVAVLTRDSGRIRGALPGLSLAAEPIAMMKKRPPTRKDRNDALDPVKQRKPGSKKKTPATRKGGRKSSKKK